VRIAELYISPSTVDGIPVGGAPIGVRVIDVVIVVGVVIIVGGITAAAGSGRPLPASSLVAQSHHRNAIIATAGNGVTIAIKRFAGRMAPTSPTWARPVGCART